MKKTIYLLFTLLIFGSLAFGAASNIYITPTGSAVGACTSSPQAPSFFNNASNWGSGAGQIGSDTIVLVCGTFTNSSQNGNVFTTKGNGTSGHPVVINFDNGTQFNSTSGWWGATSDGGTQGGAITITNNFITVNGQGNLIIQNMLAGCKQGGTNYGGGTAVCAGGVSATCPSGACTQSPSIGTTSGSAGIYVTGDHDIIENVIVKNIYINAGNSNSATDANGFNTADIVVLGATNVQIANNTLSDASIGINGGNPGGTGGNTNPNSCPSSGYCVYGNSITNCHWMIAANVTETNVGGAIWNIYGNSWGDWSNWYNPQGSYHLDGVISFGYGGHKVTDYFFNNNIFGEQGSASVGANSTSSGIYCSSTQLVDSSGSSCYIYNNVLYIADPTYSAGLVAIGGPDRCGVSSWSIASNVLTLNILSGGNCTNGISTWSWPIGEPVILSGFSGGSFLNNQTVTVSTINSSLITATFTHANASSSEASAFAYDSGNMGPYFLYNNTVINSGIINYTYVNQPAYYALTQENNVFQASSTTSANSFYGATSNGLSGWTGGILSDYNMYFNDRASLFTLGQSSWWQQAGTASAATNFTNWKTFCSCDSHGVYQNPLINGVTGALLTGSPAVGFGTNLTGLGITSLNSDMNGFSRSSSGAWTIGAFNAVSGGNPPPQPSTLPVVIAKGAN